MDSILNFTPTGMVPTKSMTPHVPISVSEIVEDVHRAVKIGITVVHLHARDPQTGEPTQKVEVYRNIIEGIRRFSKDLVIGVSLSGRRVTEFERRVEPLLLDGDLKPDMGSLTLGSLNFNGEASLNAPRTIQMLGEEMQRRGILAELEVFDLGMINYAKYLVKRGLLTPPHYFNLFFGNIDGAQADITHMGVMINDLPPQSYWSLAGIGAAQFTANSVAMACGGGVRVGLEDNIWFNGERTLLAKNSDLLKRIHVLADIHGRKVMSSVEFRQRLQLGGGAGLYGRAAAGIEKTAS